MVKSGRLGVAALLLLTAACAGTEPAATPPPAANTSAAATGTSAPAAPLSDVDKEAAPAVAQRFADLANAGDSAGVAATFAEDARFDSVGRIYPSREAIMSRFLDPEVIRAGGKYEVTGTRWNGDRYVVDYRFTTGGGGQESFYYEFLIRDGLIRDVIGRYH
ncbi:nuclear transport factor 2 family protein [Actinokineospora iranica]|uniref:SnoaL-like domain-containing protein n=1 Tax=Actinokineospora iranica TaxID=1271860 RepID=A0A1G6QEB3_9PSEU|nr:nuclear transport factor 2 family protein [Actinokineospora iranica]SDC90832.1 SnoaL-like domain-containing protein [Actinokineospora iranica]